MGTLPTEYGQLTQMSKELLHQRTKIPMHFTLTHEASAATLWLNRNSFEGTIPTEFARMTSLGKLPCKVLGSVWSCMNG